MKMEHRHSKRHTTNAMVTIAYAPLGIINARMTNLSCEGMYIDTGPIRLHHGHLVEVFFRTANGSILSLKALTIHSSQQGTGLCFTDDDAPLLLDDLQHPLYDAA